MLHPDLIVNDKKITTLQQLEPFFSADRMSCEVGECALELEFSPERGAFIAWFGEDEEDIWYFDNGSGQQQPVDLTINVCPKAWMMCYPAEDIWAVVEYFCETGKRHPGYGWVPETFEMD